MELIKFPSISSVVTPEGKLQVAKGIKSKRFFVWSDELMEYSGSNCYKQTDMVDTKFKNIISNRQDLNEYEDVAEDEQINALSITIENRISGGGESIEIDKKSSPEEPKPLSDIEKFNKIKYDLKGQVNYTQAKILDIIKNIIFFIPATIDNVFVNEEADINFAYKTTDTIFISIEAPNQERLKYSNGFYLNNGTEYLRITE